MLKPYYNKYTAKWPAQRLWIYVLICISITSCSGPQNNYTNTAHHPIVCQVCFTPGQKCLPLIIQALDQSRKSVHVMAYALTSKPIAAALVRAQQRGVDVVAVVDKSQLHTKSSKLNELRQAGVKVYIDHKPRIQHNKIMIIDEKTVIGGSYNWSDSAEKHNAENLTIMQSPMLAQQYEANFQKRKLASQVLGEAQTKSYRRR